MSKEKQIRKVVVMDKGFKGLVVEGTVESIKENKVVQNLFKDTIKHPVHLVLEDKISELRFHALNISGLITDQTDKNEKKSLLAGCDILSFEVGSDLFAIKIQSRVFDTKHMKFSTPKVDSSDGYEHFDTVVELLREILVEVHAYMKGLKKITDEEIAFMYVRHGKDSDVTTEVFNGMSNEEKQAYCVKIIEKLGGIVILNEEMNVSNVNLEEEVLMLNAPSTPDAMELVEASAEPLKVKAENGMIGSKKSDVDAIQITAK